VYSVPAIAGEAAALTTGEGRLGRAIDQASAPAKPRLRMRNGAFLGTTSIYTIFGALRVS
jgi:hypothetical protein